MPEQPKAPRVPLIDEAPALTNVVWSKEIVGQALEALFVCLREEGPRHLRPIHSPTLRLGWRPDKQPGDVVAEAASRYGLVPILVHSTSWRFESGRVVLTYIAAVEAPLDLNEHLSDDPVVRAELARGDALGPPVDIDVAQVVEHAFRHLSWLVKDDEAVREAIPEWTSFLGGYEPEPFRSFGAPPGA